MEEENPSFYICVDESLYFHSVPHGFYAFWVKYAILMLIREGRSGKWQFYAVIVQAN